MKVLDVIQLACAYLNCYSDYKLYFEPFSTGTPNSEDAITLPEEKQEKLEFLLLSFNNVQEVISKKIPLITTQNFNATSNIINFSQLNNSLNKVISIKQNNKKLSFKMQDNYILITKTDFIEGTIQVEYSYYLPKITSLDSDIPINILTKKQTLALGVASEFCFIQGLFDDADIWQTRFIKELENDCEDILIPEKTFKNFTMPKRNWR